MKKKREMKRIKSKKELTRAVEKIELTMGNIHHFGHIVWNTQQIKDVLDKYDHDNGIIKVEIAHGFEIGEKCYHVSIWRCPPIIR